MPSEITELCYSWCITDQKSDRMELWEQRLRKTELNQNILLRTITYSTQGTGTAAAWELPRAVFQEQPSRPFPTCPEGWKGKRRDSTDGREGLPGEVVRGRQGGHRRIRVCSQKQPRGWVRPDSPSLSRGSNLQWSPRDSCHWHEQEWDHSLSIRATFYEKVDFSTAKDSHTDLCE